MSDKKDIWWPRYVGDYQRKTQHLSLAEHGAYALILDYYYSSGRPPANAVQLHRICRAFAADEQAAVQVVVSTFFTEQDGYLINDRAEVELLKRSDVSKKRSEAAKIMHAKAGASADANAPTITTTVTITDNNQNIPPLPPRGRSGYPPDFETFWQTYPNRTGKAAAYKAYQSALKQHGVTHAILIDRAGQFAAAHAKAGTPAQYVPHPATWLNQGRWEDDLSRITSRGGGANPGANARGSQFNALMAAASKLMQEDGGDYIAEPRPALPEWNGESPTNLRPAFGTLTTGLPRLAGSGDSAGRQTIDHDDTGAAHG